MASRTVKRAYKQRFYPTDEQAKELARTFGCVRVVWNQLLERRTKRYVQEKSSTSYSDSSKMLTALKQEPEFAWLNEVSSVPLQQTLRYQSEAFQAFFGKRSRYPKFKSRKKSKNSAEYTTSGFRIRDGRLYLAKMRDPIHVVWTRPLELDTCRTVTVSQDRSGRFFVSLLCESVVEELPERTEVIGIDWGVSSAITTSEGFKSSPTTSRAQARVKKAQRAFSRTQKGSANRAKARKVLARRQTKVADIRRDWMHKITTQLIRENQAVVVEDLNVVGMSRRAEGKGRKSKAGLNRGILNHAPAEMRSMLTYKAEWYGRDLVIADRWFPSSQICSSCGNRGEKLHLGIRQWSCSGCGTRHDRDTNAAINLKNVALGLRETTNARGGPVRPLADSSAYGG